MRSKSATSSAPGMLAARSICRFASLRIVWPNSLAICALTSTTYRFDLGGGVDLHAVERRRQLHRLRPDRPLEDVGGRMRRIRRDEQHPLAHAARRQGRRRRARRLADAALAAEEHHAARDQRSEGIRLRAADRRRRSAGILSIPQQHGRFPRGERSMPIRRCHRWNSSSRYG